MRKGHFEISHNSRRGRGEMENNAYTKCSTNEERVFWLYLDIRFTRFRLAQSTTRCTRVCAHSNVIQNGAENADERRRNLKNSHEHWFHQTG